MNLTNEQRLAIETRAKNMLVSASAGSGKTFVLVNRIIDLIKAGEMSIDSCLIVTFTNAAAAEMRERIAKALLKEGSAQLKKLHFANISTLHAFCKNVIAEHYYTIDLNPNFKVASQQLIDLLLDEAVDDALAAGYAELSADFNAMMARFSSHRGDDTLKDYLKKIYYLAMSSPSPLVWLDDCAALYEVDGQSFPFLDQIIEHCLNEMRAYRQQLDKAYQMCLAQSGPRDYAATLQSDIAQFDFVERLTALDFTQLYQHVQQVDFVRLTAIKKANKEAVDQVLQARVKALRAAIKKHFNALKARYFARPIDSLITEQQEMQPSIRALVDLVKQAVANFQRNKLRENALDFNDLEQYTIAILSNQQVAQYYRDKFSHIFVDEYQDSNRVQEAIVNLIKRDDNLFLVGDVKQSIYRFRRAEPQLFLEKFNQYPSQQNALRVDLNNNFRTHPAILKGINDVFRNLMTTSFGGLDYQTDSMLTTIRDDFRGEAKPRLFIATDDASEQAADKSDMALQLLAKRVHAITEMHYSVAVDGAENAFEQRRFGYGDIVILLRSVKNSAAAIRDYFNQVGIPLIVDQEDSYFDLIEVATLINFLRIIDNPLKDIALLAVLRSVFGGFSDSELAEIALASDDYFFESLKQYQQSGKNDLIRQRINKFLMLYNELRANRFLPVGEFIWLLLTKTGYRHFVLGLADGAKRVKQIDVLLEKADQFESENQTGLHHFVDYLDQLKRSKISYGGKSNSDAVNAVRLMSIHKSKGLEFKAVIVANIDKRFNLRDAQDKLILHPDLGIVAKWLDPEKHLQRSTIIYNYLSELMKRETVAEEQRLLYVAMTRAIYHLELHATCSKLDKKISAWQLAESPFDLAKQGSYLDWLMSTLLPLEGYVSEQIPLKINLPHFEINLVDAADLATDGQPKTSEQDNANSLTIAKIEESFNGYSDRLPARLSVSALKNSKSGFKPAKVNLNDSFAEQSAGTVVGNLYHKIMEQLTFVNDDIAEIVADLSERIDMPVAEKINLTRLNRFIDSVLYRRIQAADKVFKEQPFVYHYELTDGQFTTLQGVIDLLFIENGKAVVVDYKSDRVSNTEELKQRYQQQVELYSEAVGKILNIEIAEQILYSIYLSKSISW